jgi:hypothetical protein
MPHRMRRLPAAVITAIVLAGASTVAAVGAASADTGSGLSSSVSLTVLEPTPGQVITGPSLAIQVLATGYQIDARYAGTPNLPSIGHYHEILDGNLVDMTPLRDGNRDTVPMTGVSDGWHTLTLVPANNDHSMIMPAAVSIPFDYAGPYLPEPAGYAGPGTPGIAITSPADGSAVQGSSFTMTVNVTNFVVCGDCFGKALVAGEGHWHIFVDQVDMAHMKVMGGGPSQEVSVKGVTPGWHTFYALLVDNHHMPIMPMTMASVRLYVASDS